MKTDHPASLEPEETRLTPDPQHGALHVVGPDRWTTGQRVELMLIYTAGPDGLPAGSRVRIGLPNTAWTRPLVPFVRYWEEFERGDHRHYVPFKRVNTVAEAVTDGPAGVHLESEERMMGPDIPSEVSFWRWWITAVIEGGDLSGGDRIEIRYGVRDCGEDGAFIQRWCGEVCFAGFVQPGGRGAYRQLAGSPHYIDVRAGAGEKLHLFVPSIVAPGEEFSARLAITDAFDCPPDDTFSGTVRVLAPTGGEAASFTADNRNAIAVGRLRVEQPGPCRFRVRDDRKRQAAGNPCLCRDGGPKLFWGDLHAHSRFHVFNDQTDARYTSRSSSLACGDPAELYAYARDTAGLDFAAVTDQGGICSPGWEPTQQTTREFHEPGRFVTFRGYEAGVLSGHLNVIYADDAVEPPQDPDGFGLNPEDLFAFYRGRDDVMLIPHHVKIWTDWDRYDSQLEPLLEIYSTWGSSESAGVDYWWDKGQTPGAGAHAAWARGHRMGVIASSDTHVGMPGRSVRNGDRQWTCQNHPGGLAGVWCKELTREAIFRALRRRRCYGTTGARMIVELFADGEPMGSEIQVDNPHRKRRITGLVVGTDELTQIDLFRNNGVVRRVDSPRSERFSLDWTDDDPPAGVSWYYLRVTQRDGNRAWTSPIWFEPAER